jgi:hypothetical protein
MSAQEMVRTKTPKIKKALDRVIGYEFVSPGDFQKYMDYLSINAALRTLSMENLELIEALQYAKPSTETALQSIK